MYSIGLSTNVRDEPVINKLSSDNEIDYSTIKGKKVNDSTKFNIFLNDLMQSPTHSSILKTKVDYIISKHSIEALNYSSSVDANNIMNGVNAKEDLTDLLFRISFDYEKYNAFAFEVIPSKGGGFHSLGYVDYSKLLFGKDEEIYYGKDLTLLEKFNDKTKKGVYVYKPCALNVIPTPVYAAAYDSISTEIAINQYQLSNVTNGFSAGALINFVEEVEPSEEEVKKRARAIREKMVGQKNGGSVHLNWSSSKDNAPTIQQFTPTNLDKQYEVLSKQNKDSIVTAHTAVAGELFGIQKDGGVFDTAHLKEAYNILSNIYIKNRQRIIMQSVNYVFKTFDLGIALKLEVENLFSEPQVGNPPDAYQLKIAGFTSEEMKEIFKSFYGI